MEIFYGAWAIMFLLSLVNLADMYPTSKIVIKICEVFNYRIF
jgi:hypothetical protein